MTLPGCWYYIRDDNYIKSKFSIFFNMQSFPRIQRTYSAFNLLRIGWQDNCKDTLIGEHSYYLVGTSYGLTSLFAAEDIRGRWNGTAIIIYSDIYSSHSLWIFIHVYKNIQVLNIFDKFQWLIEINEKKRIRHLPFIYNGLGL